MLDINVIRENPQRVKEALAKKLWDVDFTELLEWDKRKKELIQIVESNKAKMNELSASVPAAKKAGDDVNLIFAKVREIAANNKNFEEELKELDEKIFNFLADSFKYNRVNDLGYMIGRIMINKEGHYYVEGKRELAQVFNNFSANKITPENAHSILRSAIEYTINFDLLLPNYDEMKIITVNDMLQFEDQNMTLRTGKRLGFRFEQDIMDEKK